MALRTLPFAAYIQNPGKMLRGTCSYLRETAATVHFSDKKHAPQLLLLKLTLGQTELESFGEFRRKRVA